MFTLKLLETCSASDVRQALTEANGSISEMQVGSAGRSGFSLTKRAGFTHSQSAGALALNIQDVFHQNYTETHVLQKPGLIQFVRFI